MHKHQRIDKPNPPSVASVPLPPWVQWKQGQTRSTCSYVVIEELVPGYVGDMSATSSGQGDDVSRACRCIEPRTQNPEPEKIVSLSERAHAREEAAAAQSPAPKGSLWLMPDRRIQLDEWRRHNKFGMPPEQLATEVEDSIKLGITDALATHLVGYVAQRSRAPDPKTGKRTWSVAKYYRGIINTLLNADPPAITVEQFEARQAEFESGSAGDDKPKFLNGFR